MTEHSTAGEPATGTEPTSEQGDASTEVTSVQDPLGGLLGHIRYVAATVDNVENQQRLHGQLLLAQAQVLREVQQLLVEFGPVLRRWADSPAGRVAGFLGGRRAAPDTTEVHG